MRPAAVRPHHQGTAMSVNTSADARKLRENCNEEYAVLDVLESGMLVKVKDGAIDWAAGVRDLLNEARRMVRAGADPRGLPDEPDSITTVNDARRLVDGIAKWATALMAQAKVPKSDPPAADPAAPVAPKQGRKKHAREKHLTWKEWAKQGMSSGEIALKWKDEKKEDITPAGVGRAIRRLKAEDEAQGEDADIS